MHKVDVSLHWWDLTNNILGKQHTLYRSFFRWKIQAQIMRFTVYWFGFWLLKLRKQAQIMMISDLLRKTQVYLSSTTKDKAVVVEIYQPSLTASVTRVKSGMYSNKEFKKVWAPNLSLY